MQRVVIAALFLAFLICYLEWVHHAAFIFQLEYELLFSGRARVSGFMHPAIFIPMGGQIILLVSAVQKRPRRLWVIIAIILLSLLVLLIFLAGILGMKPKMIISCLPFLSLAVYYVLPYGRRLSIRRQYGL